MMFGWCMDTVDTYTKFISDNSKDGMDEYLGEYIAARWKEKYNEDLVSPKEVMEIIYLGAKANHPNLIVSSSHRRFVQIESGSSQPTINNHIDFVLGKKPDRFKMGYEGGDSKEFYDSMSKRFNCFGWA